MSEHRCNSYEAVLVARPGRVWLCYYEHTPAPGLVPLGKPCGCDDCYGSDAPLEAYGVKIPVPDDLALWECPHCGRFSMLFAHLDVAFQWLDRVAPLSSMPRVPPTP
jgi:hypothetical protein